MKIKIYQSKIFPSLFPLSSLCIYEQEKSKDLKKLGLFAQEHIKSSVTVLTAGHQFVEGLGISRVRISVD